MSKQKQLIVCMAYFLGAGGQLDRDAIKALALKAGVTERTAYRAKKVVMETRMIEI